MALIGDSLGVGIGLSAQPELFSGIAEASKEKALQRRALADQKKKEQQMKQAKNFDDYLKNIEVKGIHPIYEKKLSEQTAQVLQMMQDKRNADPYGNWSNDPELRSKLQELKFSFNDYKHGGDELDKDFQEIRVHPKDYNIDPDLLDAVKKNDYEKFTDILKEKGYSNSDLYSGGLLSKIEIPFDKDKPINALLPVVKTTGYESETPEGGTSSKVKSIDMDATLEGVNNWIDNNPDYVNKAFGGNKDAARKYIMDTQIMPKVNASSEFKKTEKSSKLKYGKSGASNDKWDIKHGPMKLEGVEGGQGNEIVFENKKRDTVPKFGATVNGESVVIENPSVYTGGDPKSFDAKWMVSGTVKKQEPVLDKEGKQVYESQPDPLDPTKTKDVPQYKTIETQVRIPYDQVAPEMKAKFDFDLNEYVKNADFGSQQKKEQGGKIISKSKLESLVGTKDYEGYTYDEIVKYYEDNGYEVK